MGKDIKDVFNREALIVFDGTSYCGIFAVDLEDCQKVYPDIEVIEKHSYWSDHMDRRIEDLNNGI